MFDKSKTTSESREQISLDTILSVDDEKDMLLPAFQNVTDAEKRCVFRVGLTFLHHSIWMCFLVVFNLIHEFIVFQLVFRTAEKTERVVYMLAASENEKINWMSVLKRNIPNSPRHVSFVKNKEDYFKGNIVCQFSTSDSLCVNQVLQLSSDVSILAGFTIKACLFYVFFNVITILILIN